MISIVEKEVKEKEKEEEKPWKKGTGGWLVQSAPGKGRGVFREKGKRVGRGDLIQEELPLCCVLNDELVTTHCDGCFEERESLFRCAGCKATFYCSRACQKKGWAAHKFECKCLKVAAPNKPTRSMRLMFRFIGEVTARGDDTTHLLSHRDHLSSETISNITHLAIGTHNIVSKVLKKGEEEVEREREKEVQKMTEKFCMFMSNCLVMSDGEMREVGVGLFLGLAMINHSCAPNAVCSFEGKKGRVRAIRALEEGEELTICYLERGKPTPQRKQALESHFFFSCSCSACLSFPSQMDMKMTALSCPRCPEESHRKGGKEGNGYVCTSCSHFIEESDAKEIVLNILGNYTKDGSPFDAESYNFREGTLDYLFENYQKLKKIVGKNNIVRFEIERNLIDRSIEEERWIDALNAAKDQTHSLIEYYGQYWPIVGLHYFRMGKIQKIFSDPQAGSSLEKAVEILTITHGNNHPLVQEGLQNLVQVKMMSDFGQLQLT